MVEKKTVLFLASNPKGHSEIRSTKERTKLKKIFKKENLKDAFHFESEFNVTIENFIDSIIETDPWLVHFCGHGKKDKGIFLEKRGRKENELNVGAFVSQIKNCHSVEGVFLNSCYSAKMADDFTEYVDFFIGIKGEVGNKTAIKFAETFYNLFNTYETIWFAMNQVENTLATLKFKNFRPVLRWNKQKIMLQARNDIEAHLLLKVKEVARLSGKAIVDKKRVKQILNDPKRVNSYKAILESHPYSQIPIWFDQEKEVLVLKIAAKCMAGEDEKSKTRFGRVLNRLFGYLDMVIVSYDIRDISKEEIADNLGDKYAKSLFVRALKILETKVPKGFSDDSQAYFRDCCKYLAERVE